MNSCTSHPDGCQGCVLNEEGNGFVNIEGSGTSGVLVLDEKPGHHEIAAGFSLRPNSPAGSIFAGLVRRIPGLERNHLHLSSVVRCQPPRNWLSGAPYEHSAINHCVENHAADLIRRRRPRAILALGASVLRTLTGMSGYNQGIKLLRGFQLFTNRPEFMLDGKPIPVVATYDPAFLLLASKTRAKKGEAVEGGATGAKVEKAEGGMALSGCVQRDIKLALQIAAHGPLKPRVVRAITGTRENMAQLILDFRNHPEWIMYHDIETPRSIDKAGDESEIDVIQAQVKAIQFGWNEHEAFVYPGFDNEWVKRGSEELMSLPNIKFGWNSRGFDEPVLHGHGIYYAGLHIDGMDAWHWIQPDLPRGLQFATSWAAPDLTPWKHLAIADEETYCAYDIASLALDWAYIQKEMEKYGLRTAFDRHCLKLQREMHSVTLRGIPMDEERHREFGKTVGEKVVALESRIRLAIPEPVLLLEPKRKTKPGETAGSGWDGTRELKEFGFVRTPKVLETHIAQHPYADKIVLNELVEEEVEVDDERTEIRTSIQPVTYILRHAEFYNKKLGVILDEPRWHRQLPFSTQSVQQKLNYIRFRREEEVQKRISKGQGRADAERLAKYKVPMVTDKKTGKKKENSGSKELAKLAKATGDPVFVDLVDISKHKKLEGTYGPESKWRARNGFVHPTFGLSDTGTGQIASWDPNAQNAPKHGDLAYLFRRCVHAKPGYVLLEFDKKSFHAQTLARLARDLAYGRMSAIDVHSYMTAHRLKLPEAHQLLSWSNKDIKAWFTKMKEDPRLYKHEAGVAFPNGMTFQEIRDFKSKRVILGIGFGQGAGSIYEQNPEGYKDKKEVQTFLDLIREVFGPIFVFQKDITQLAHKKNMLVSTWGYIRRFFDVFQWDPNKWNQYAGSMGDWTHGDDYEAAIAFLPANDAFGMIKEEMLRLAGFRNSLQQIVAERESEDLLEKYGLINQIHDSLMFHCRLELRDKCVEDVLRIMREPCLALADEVMCPEGFFVDAEVAVGDDWTSMEKLKGV